ncbi:hypothetical protein [Streptomyces sp. F001]|uniref:hypothetical protein n=1 Tax=Streptomyces sp. F001 TaxID=1510026 RepID=UPI00101E474B|nr:hypothetical protein [Streptomyces sp. F001]
MSDGVGAVDPPPHRGREGNERLPLIRLTVPALAALLAATMLSPHHDDAYRLQQHHWRALTETQPTDHRLATPRQDV